MTGNRSNMPGQVQRAKGTSISVRARSWEGVYITVQPLILNLISVPATFYIITAQGETKFGYWATATSIATALMVFGSLGLRPLFVRTVSQDRSTAAVRLGHHITLRFLFCLFASLIAIIACIAVRYPPVVVVCVGIASVGSMLSAVSDALTDTLHAFERFTAQATAFLLSGVCLTIASVVVCWLGMGPVALTVSYLVGPVLNVLIMATVIIRQLFWFRPRWDLKAFRGAIRESRFLSRNAILLSIHDRVEQLVLPKFVSPGHFGQFSAGLLPASRLAVVPSSITTVFFPRIARTALTETRGRHLTRDLFLAMLVTCPPTALGVVFFAPWISHVLFPRNPALCQAVIRSTMWSLPITGVMWAMIGSLQAAGHHERQAVAGIKTSVINIIIGTALITKFGLYGACVSWLMRPAVGCALLVGPFRAAFPGLLRDLPFGRVVLAGAAMEGVLAIGGTVFGTGLAQLCLVGFIASIVFYLVLIALRVISISTLSSFVVDKRVETHCDIIGEVQV